MFETLQKYFEPKPVINAEHFRFYQQDQATGESIIEYIAELWWLKTHCQFREYLDKALHNHFVYGLRSSGIQKRQLTEAGLLMLKKTLEVVVAVKVADQKAK